MRLFEVLGVKVAAVQLRDVVELMKQWIPNKGHPHYICVANVNSVMFAIKNQAYRHALNCADVVVPDGMPLVWIGRSRGFSLKKRVYGPDLLLAFCRLARKKGYSSFFYGGVTGTPERMVENLKTKFPELKVVGTYSPPFRPLTNEEDKQVVQMINNASPDVLWVGLGCPKQEHWMYEHKGVIKVSVMIGVGAAFDFLSGKVRQAPKWMQNMGLEWLFRLLQEPKRLSYRYLIYNPLVALHLLLQWSRLRKY